MAKKAKTKKIFKGLLRFPPPVVIGLLTFSFVLCGYATLSALKLTSPTKIPTSKITGSAQTVHEPKVSSPSVVKTPTVNNPTTKATIAPPSATPKPVVTTSSSPAPVVVPSPNSNVSSLTPTNQSPPAPSGPPSQPQTTGYTSTNWSGYLAASGDFTTVAASWTVPTPTGNGLNTSADATWVGIGGVTSDDLIQTGTMNTVTASGQVTAEAFYELLPGGSVTVPGVTVAIGDSISATITETSSSQWIIYIIDHTSGQSFSKNTTYTSTNSSAEWIEEDPSFGNGHLVPLDKFGTVSFYNALTAEGGSPLNLTGANAQPITMLSGYTGSAVSTPSAIGSDGASFTITRN